MEEQISTVNRLPEHTIQCVSSDDVYVTLNHAFFDNYNVTSNSIEGFKYILQENEEKEESNKGSASSDKNKGTKRQEDYISFIKSRVEAEERYENRITTGSKDSDS